MEFSFMMANFSLQLCSKDIASERKSLNKMLPLQEASEYAYTVHSVPAFYLRTLSVCI